MALVYTTGKSVLLSDNQIQTEVIVTDNKGMQVYVDHVSYRGSLVDRVKQLDQMLSAKFSPPVLPTPGTVIDLSPLVQPRVKPPIVVPPTQAELDDAKFFDDVEAEELAKRQQARFDALSPALQKQCTPDRQARL